MTYKEHLAKALEKMPDGTWKCMLQIVYDHACNGGKDVKPLSGGGGGGGNPPEPPR